MTSTEAKPATSTALLLDRFSELRVIVKWAKSEKIERLKIGQFEVEFLPTAHQKPADPEKPKSSLQIKIDQERKNRELEELITWSS